MTKQYYLEAALLPQGWVKGALVGVADGFISTIHTLQIGDAHAAPPEGISHVRGVVVPGMANAHSHAFQRGMAGKSECRASATDSFWTWRRAMYALANRIEPEDLYTLATQLFIEMLKAGYTSVAEFHYLHRQRDGELYPDGQGLWEAVSAAAATAGIALTLLPTLYQAGDFDGKPLAPDQRRFALDTDWFLRSIESCLGAERRGAGIRRTGAAFHSLRAVPLATLREVARALRQMDPTMPLHIHVAEQIKEVQSCKRQTGRRPIELLLHTGLLDQHWCLVHATHATPAELRGVASSQAAVCVSISTEANLGDGFFAASRFLSMGGRICIGSDSQATVCPAEELRWMEYQQRLRKQRRAVLADKRESHVGTRLWRDAAQHGARAIGQPAGAIEVGRRADWLVLDTEHPSMVGASTDTVLDHLVFAGGSAAIRDVMVNGNWVVTESRHAAELPLRPAFSALMQRLAQIQSPPSA